ncbi:MAG: TipAS antibiotic-recognition domain-containing protein, partial [Planctomycetota bacterium]
IGAALDDPAHAPLALVERHVARLDAEIDSARRLRDRLEAIASSLRSATAPAVADLLGAIETMNEMERFKQHYTTEQLEYLEQRARDVGAERMASVQDDWRELFAAFQDAHERGLDPSSDEVSALAARHRALVDEFTGGREDVREALGRANEANPDAMRAFGVDDALSEYVRRATES